MFSQQFLFDDIVWWRNTANQINRRKGKLILYDLI